MSQRETYLAGVPCWVDILDPDTLRARAFYGALFKWEFAGPEPTPGTPSGDYYVAQVDGRDVAGIGSSARKGSVLPVWSTYVRVSNVSASSKIALNRGGSILIPPTDATPAGRFAVIADPEGAAIGLWEAGTREGAQLVNEVRAWALSTLHTTDGGASARFYSNVFGWEPEEIGAGPRQTTLWHLAGYFGGVPSQPVARDVVALMVADGGGRTRRGIEPCWSVDFWVASVDQSADDCEALGGVVLSPPIDSPGFRSAELADPSGAVFTIAQVVGVSTAG